jgi:hypothetical protein
MPNYKTDRVKILGVDFFNGSVQQAIKEIVKGGYIVVPSGPGLVTLPMTPDMRKRLSKVIWQLLTAGTWCCSGFSFEGRG